MSSWEETFSDGSRSLKKFDYPSSGPVDIHAMEVPHDAEVVDRISSSDITKIADKLRTGRTSFDDYDMIFVEDVEGQDFSPTQSHGLNARRVRRHGNQYRVDGLLRAKPEIASPAAGTDMRKWWIEHRDDDLAGVRPTTYWCDPKHDYCVVKAVQPVISKESGKPELAYLDTEEFSEYTQSPGGHWYPQKTRRSVSTNKAVQIRQYYMDFEVEFADDLFQPLNLSQQ